jgi:hypothetical protein
MLVSGTSGEAPAYLYDKNLSYMLYDKSDLYSNALYPLPTHGSLWCRGGDARPLGRPYH